MMNTGASPDREDNISNRSMEKRWGLVLFIAILGYYFYLLPSFAVPGRWAGIAASFSGLDPFRPVIRPVWSALTALVAALPIANIGFAYNIMTALAGAASCWLLYEIVRRIPFSRTLWRGNREEVERIPRFLAALTAALFFAVSYPVIIFSTRGDYSIVDVLLLLVALHQVTLYIERPRAGCLYASCALMGLAIVEYPVALLVLPGFVLWWTFIFMRRPLPKTSTYVLAGSLMLSGLVVLCVYAFLYDGSQSAQLRDVKGPAQVIGEYARFYFLELTRGVPRVGWLLVLGLNVVPFAAVMLRELDEPADMFSALGVYVFRGVLIMIAVMTLFELPGSSAYIIGQQAMLIAPSLLVAVWSGFLIGYFYHILTLPPSGGMNRERVTGRRNLAGAMVSGWVILIILAGFRNGADARVNHLAPVARFADEVIADLNGRDLLVTDGVFDAQLHLAARQAGVQPNIINLQAASPERARYYAGMFDDQQIRSLAMISVTAALRDWVVRNAGAMERIALLVSPEALRMPSVEAQPARNFYVPISSGSEMDAESLLDRQVANLPGRGLAVPAHMDASDEGWFQWQYMNRWISRLFNDTGFLLAEQGNDSLAGDAYKRALEVWPENPSALINLLDQQALSLVDPDREAWLKQLQKIAEENPRTMNVLYLNGVSGRLRNPGAMLAYVEQSGGAGDRDDLLDKLATRIDYGDENSLLSLARLYLRGKGIVQSEAIYNAMLEENPENLDAHHGLLQVAMIRGDAGKAKDILRTMERLGADRRRLDFERAHTALLEGDLEGARQQFLEITKQPGNNSRAWLALMQIGLRGQNTSLIEAASGALRRDQLFAPGLLSLGDQALREGRFQDARANFGRALELEPGNEEILLRLMLLANRARDAASMQHYSGQLLSQSPDHPLGHWVAGNVHAMAVRYDLAEASFRRSVEAQESAEALSELAFALARQKKFAEALPHARRAIAVDRNLARAWAVQADIERAMGLKEDAIGSVQMALVKNLNRSPGVDLLAAEIYMEFGRLDEADKLLVGISPSSGLLDKEERKRWSELLKARGKSSEALAYTRQASDLAAEGGDDAISRAEEWYGQATMALAEKRWEDARYYLSRARGLQPDHPLILGLSGRVEMMTGDYRAAAEFWQELHRLYPDNAAVLAGLAALDLYGKNFAEAGRKLDQASKIDAANLYARIYRAALAARASDERAIRDALGSPGTRALAFFAGIVYAEGDALRGALDFAQMNLLIGKLLGLSAEQDAAGVLESILPSLQSAADGLEKENWPVVADALVRVREAGVTWPAIVYDLALANYRTNPDSAMLEELAAVLRNPGGRDFTGIFFLLCLMDDRAADAERLAGDLLDAVPALDALLIRAALRRDQGDVEGAWRILEGVPNGQRPSLGPWFEQDIAVVRKLKSDVAFTLWMD